MAEPNITKIDDSQIEYAEVMTGDRNRGRFLYYQLRDSISKAKRIDIIVSFLMESGVKMLLDDLRDALDRGVTIRLLTGNYLGITQPSALYLLKRELGDRIDLRFYNEKDRSFHPKSYIFHYENTSEIYIGSSNISRSALTSGIEWNYRFRSERDMKNFLGFYETFEDLFYNHSIIIDDRELKRYSKNWHRPSIAKDLNRYDEVEEESNNVTQILSPRGAQIEALYALEQSRADGAVKGLVQAATGVGKTYLAAFDSMNYNRVLFVAHREEILNQAAISFKNVRESDDYGFFNGKQKDTDKSVIFASVASLGREEYLQNMYFTRDYFDYIVIDEFHHAVNSQYRRIIDYFRPKFLLGLTATPERMDGKNIYEICDYNVPYEISLRDAINKGMLVPFHYYGVYDETDYTGIRIVKGHYDERQLTQTYMGNVKRYDLIYKHYVKYNSRRALGFCCSRLHAEEMAKEFSKRGIPSVAVYSDARGEYSDNRADAIRKLKDGDIRVIFSVDMFNEGTDISNLDMVMFLRPTESPVIFLQQLGRGLRRCKGKEYLNVLDFIGNYEKAGRTPLLLRGDSSTTDTSTRKGTDNYPDDCIVDFDIHLLDLFEELRKRNYKIHDVIKQEYLKVEALIDKVPTRMELFTYMEDDVYQLCMRTSKENPFRKYVDYRHELGVLTEEQELLYEGIGREFLLYLETTDMQKVYKMPILYSIYNEGNIRMQVTDEEILCDWKKFFGTGINYRDLKKDITYDEYMKVTDRQHLANIKKNPVKYLKSSGKGFFVDREGYAIALTNQLEQVIQNRAFVEEMKDILEYRTMEYYRRRYESNRQD